MKKLLLLTLFLSTKIVSAQVEINPASNADLNLKSQTKGMLLPRINKPADISSPAEGTLIYNKESKTPAFHNGTAWNMVATTAATSTVMTDSISYTLSGFELGFYFNEALKLNSFNIVGGAVVNQSSTPVLGPVTVQFSKMQDKNSIGFMMNFTKVHKMTDLVMEVKMFRRGATSPYFSYKIRDFVISNYQSGVTPTGPEEILTVVARIIGSKDWITSQEWAFNLTTGSSTSY